MQRAVLGGIIVAVLCALIGIFVTLRRESFISDAVAHASLLGIALGFLLSTQPLFLAVVVGVVMSVLIVYLKHNTKISTDAIIGILFSVLFAFGVIILYITPGYRPELETYLFGSILAVNWNDIIYASGVLVITFFLVNILYPKLVYMTLDEDAAYVRGVKVRRLEYLIAILTSIIIIISLKIAGIILVTALIIIPATTAKLMAKNFSQMIPISIAHSIVSVILGILIARNFPPGPTIVITSGAIFFLVFILKKLRLF